MSEINKIVVSPFVIKTLVKIFAESRANEIANKGYHEDWLFTVLAVDLCSNLETVKMIKKALKENKLSGAKAFCWILMDWIHTNGRNATLDKFLSILVSNGLTTLAGMFQNAFDGWNERIVTEEEQFYQIYFERKLKWRRIHSREDCLKKAAIRYNLKQFFATKLLKTSISLTSEQQTRLLKLISNACSTSGSCRRGGQIKRRLELLRILQQLKELLFPEKNKFNSEPKNLF